MVHADIQDSNCQSTWQAPTTSPTPSFSTTTTSDADAAVGDHSTASHDSTMKDDINNNANNVPPPLHRQQHPHQLLTPSEVGDLLINPRFSLDCCPCCQSSKSIGAFCFSCGEVMCPDCSLLHPHTHHGGLMSVSGSTTLPHTNSTITTRVSPVIKTKRYLHKSGFSTQEVRNLTTTNAPSYLHGVQQYKINGGYIVWTLPKAISENESSSGGISSSGGAAHGSASSHHHRQSKSTFTKECQGCRIKINDNHDFCCMLCKLAPVAMREIVLEQQQRATPPTPNNSGEKRGGKSECVGDQTVQGFGESSPTKRRKVNTPIRSPVA
jgi:hypothetical protein